MAIIIKPPVSGGGGGAVDSVNGQTGVVVLTTDNIAEGSNADRQYFTSADQGNVSTLQSDMTTAQSDISTLQSDVSTAQSDILSVQAKTLYSNSYYVNDAVNDIQTVLDGIAGSSGISAIYMSVGSYGGSTVTISNHANVNILAPESPTGVHGCELLSRGLTISGASTTRIKIENLNIEGAFLINGTEGRHYFKNVIFDSTVTINNACANFITFEQCSFAGGISIASNVTATIYFDRCAMGNQFVTSSRSGAGSPLLTILTECSGVNLLQTNLTSNVVTVGRTSYNDLSIKQFQNADVYVYDLNNGLSTSFSGSYSELRNKPTIPTSSDDLTEGSTNLFYTNSRFDARLATKTTDNLTQGSTNLYFTNALAKTAAVVNSTAGSETDQAPSVSAMKSYVTANGGTVNSVNSVSPVAGNVTLTTDNINQGSTNLYFTNTNFDNRLATKTTDNLTEGSTNLYYTSTRVNSAFDTRLATKTTDNLTEGSTNKYFSDTLARNAFSAGTGITITSGQIATTITQYTDELAQDASASLLTSGSHTGISYSYVDGSNKIDSTVSLSGFSINALSDVDTATTAPTTNQVLSWNGTNWIPATVGGGATRPTISDKTSNFTISTPSVTTLQEIYTVSGSSAVTMTLPDATACASMRYDIKRLGTATVTIACNGVQTIDGSATIQLLAQYASVTVISTGSN